MSALNKVRIFYKTVEKFLSQRPQLGAVGLGFFAEKQ